MYKIIDTPWNTSSQIQCLAESGIETIIRYYDLANSKTLYQKRLEFPEAKAISAAGLKIMAVFEAASNNVLDFTTETGNRDGKSAYQWAKNQIRQPAGTAIYFAVDYDASESDLINNIIPYFKGIKQTFESLSGGFSTYDVGVYGSGLVVNRLKEEGLCSYRWLSMSTGFSGTRKALQDGEYELSQIAPATKRCGIDCDYDVQNPEAENIGAFSLEG